MIDSRDFHFYKHAGQTDQFPEELLFDSPRADYLQPIGDTKCTCITVCEVTTDKTGKQYDIDELYSRVPHDNNGADPKNALKSGIDYLVSNGQKETPWVSYFSAHTGNYDFFDNVRSSITLAENSICVWTPWYDNWRTSILPKGQNVTNYHMYSIEGWKNVNGQPMLQIEAWVGYKMYMSRDVFNEVMSTWFSGSAVLSDTIIELKRKKTILEMILDTLKNLVISLQLKRAQPVMSIPDPTPVPQLIEDKNEALYELSKSLIGQHLTLNPTVPKELGCCQALSFVLNKFGSPIPKGGISGTASMKEWLDNNFTLIQSPRKGSIVLYVTDTGITGSRGHVFIQGEYQRMSNDSSTGLWKAHWDIKASQQYYEDTLKMKPCCYDPK